MNKLEIIKQFEGKTPATKNKILKYIKGMLKQGGFVKPTDDRIYQEVVNIHPIWKNDKWKIYKNTSIGSGQLRTI